MSEPIGLPFSWMGTKVNMRGVLLPLIEQFPRTLYVEPFCGAGGLFFGKPQERAEILNDSNRAIVNAFRALRDDETFSQVMRLLRLTPHSREEYAATSTILRKYLRGDDFADDVKAASLDGYSTTVVAAFAFLYVQNCCFRGAGILASYGGGCKGADSDNSVKERRAHEGFLPAVHKRLQSVQLENLNALDVVKKYDHEDTFFFIDPPYACSSSKGGYQSGWDVDSDRELVELLTRIKGSYVLTVYDTPDYRALLRDGARSFDVHKKTTVASQFNGGQARVETVYFKSRRSVVYLEHERPSLFQFVKTPVGV